MPDRPLIGTCRIGAEWPQRRQAPIGTCSIGAEWPQRRSAGKPSLSRKAPSVRFHPGLLLHMQQVSECGSLLAEGSPGQ